jgi:hypothetical protein
MSSGTLPARYPRIEAKFAWLLSLARRVRAQERGQRGAKVYSLHAPEVECIGKGKPHKPYEFGVKVSVATTLKHSKGGQFVAHAQALPVNPYERRRDRSQRLPVGVEGRSRTGTAAGVPIAGTRSTMGGLNMRSFALIEDDRATMLHVRHDGDVTVFDRGRESPIRFRSAMHVDGDTTWRLLSRVMNGLVRAEDRLIRIDRLVERLHTGWRPVAGEIDPEIP